MFEEIIISTENFTPVLIMGLLIGIGHAFESDHLAAVGTQLFKQKIKNSKKKPLITYALTKSSLVGVFWGAGHTTTLLVIGIIAYFFAITIQDEIFSIFELIVAVMLIFLGITTIWKKKFTIQHRHPHQHSDGIMHFDVHQHNDNDHKHEHKSYLIGLIHGLAGSGSLIALASTTFDNVEMALTFIFLFGLGSIIGMIVVGGSIGLPILLTNNMYLLSRFFRYGTGLISLIIGINILFETGIVNNLS